MPKLLGPRDGIAVELPTGKRIFIAADDHPNVNPEALAWCDVFGIVNLRPDKAGCIADSRIVPIGPSMGIRWRSDLQAASYLIRARLSGGNRFAGLPARLRSLIKHQHERLPLSAYRTGQTKSNYLFFISSAWKRHPGTISPRLHFIETAKAMKGLQFEGGVVGGDDPHLAAERPYPLAEYISKTQASVLAFNTPAVHECLGWKLAEFLALGKAIVTLPLPRVMPSPLVHGVHAHIVDGSRESIQAAIEKICADTAYRQLLEHNARAYFDEWLAPKAVAARLIAICQS